MHNGDAYPDAYQVWDLGGGEAVVGSFRSSLFECPVGFDVFDVVVGQVAASPPAILARLGNKLGLGLGLAPAAAKVRALLMKPEPLTADVMLANGAGGVAWRSALDAAAQAGGNVVEWWFNLRARIARDGSELGLACLAVVWLGVGHNTECVVPGLGVARWTGLSLVKMPFATIYRNFCCPSVQTSMAVGQVVVFRSVR